MSFKVTFRDKTSTLISLEKGEKLKELLLAARPPESIEINGELYRRTEIVSVKKAVGGTDYSPVPDWVQDAKQLAEGKGCRGEHSLAKELMRIASEKKNFKLLADKQWRKEQEEFLRSTGQVFCNNKTGECYCSKK